MGDYRIPEYGLIDKKGDSGGQTLDRLNFIFHQCQQWRAPQESEWEQNALFVAGDQWSKIVYDTNLRASRKVDPPKNDRQSHAVSNLVFTLLRQAMSAFRDKGGRRIAIPASTDPEDIEAAGIATKFLYDYYDSHNESETQFYETLLAAVCGRCLRMTYWDGDAAGKTFGPEGTPTRVAGLGEIASIVLTPYRYHIDPRCERFDDCRFVIVSDLRDVEEMRSLFPGKEILPEEYNENTHRLDRIMTNIGSSPYNTAIPSPKDVCILKRMYCRPDPEHLNGRVIWFTKDLLLEIGDLPDGIFPFDAIDWFPVPLRQAPLPFITPIRQPQSQYNALLSQLLDLANNQLRGDGISNSMQSVYEEIDAGTGRKTIHTPPGSDFQLMTYNLNATQANLLLDRSWQDMQQAAGVQETSMGDVPSSIRSGIAIKLLQDKDTQGLSLFMTGFRASWEKIDRKKLVLAPKHYHIPRIAQIVGDNKMREITAFVGAQLRGTNDVRTRNIPMRTEVEEQQLRADLVAQLCYGPYINIQDRVAKCMMIQSSLLSGAEDEIENICAAYGGFEEAQKIAGELDALKTKAEFAQVAAMIAMGGMPQPGPGGQPQPQPAGAM